MPTVIHRTFADRYLLRKARAIAASNPAKDAPLAALRILGLLQRRCGVPSWAGFYALSRGALRLRRFREDPLWEFPPPYRPERTLHPPMGGVSARPLPALSMTDLRVPVVRSGAVVALLRIYLTETEADRAPEAGLLEELARTIEPLCAGPRRVRATAPASRATGSA